MDRLYTCLYRSRQFIGFLSGVGVYFAFVIPFQTSNNIDFNLPLDIICPAIVGGVWSLSAHLFKIKKYEIKKKTIIITNLNEIVRPNETINLNEIISPSVISSLNEIAYDKQTETTPLLKKSPNIVILYNLQNNLNNLSDLENPTAESDTLPMDAPITLPTSPSSIPVTPTPPKPLST